MTAEGRVWPKATYINMRLGINQPYFFPYIGYFSLIKHVDEFILFDTPQFIRHGWIERNRILNPNGGYVYISVPLNKHGQKTAIMDITIRNDNDWKGKILSQLVHYKKAPYYTEVVGMVRDVLSSTYTDIVSINKVAIGEVCRYLGIDTNIDVYSSMGLKVKPADAPDEWALNICKAIPGANEYWNLQGGKTFFDTGKYESAGIDIKFLKMHLTEYKQGGKPFESGLSIIDVMMFNSPQEINDMMDDFELL